MDLLRAEPLREAMKGLNREMSYYEMARIIDPERVEYDPQIKTTVPKTTYRLIERLKSGQEMVKSNNAVRICEALHLDFTRLYPDV